MEESEQTPMTSTPPAYKPTYQNVEDRSEKVEILFTSDADALIAAETKELTTVKLHWPGGKSSLLERLDYLTSIFPFELIDLRETKPLSSKSGKWVGTFTYHGSEIDRPRFEENFASLISPRKQELAT